MTLSTTERRIVEMLAAGDDLATIEEELFLSRSSLRGKLRRISRKLAGGRRVAWDDLPQLLEEAERAA